MRRDNGDVLWAKTYGGSSSDYGYSVRQTSDGGYIVAGYTESFGVAGDVYLVRTDSLGELLWSRTFGGTGNDGGWSVQQTTDGGYVITGYSASFGAGNKDVYLIKTDEFGWSGCNESVAGTIKASVATIVNSPQTLISSGALISNTATITGDALTVDTFVCSNFPTDINQMQDYPKAKQFVLFQSYPNPFNSSTTIHFEVPFIAEVTLKIFDIHGREVDTLINRSFEPGKYKVQWNANGFVSGIYFYRLQSGTFTDTRKIILSK